MLKNLPKVIALLSIVIFLSACSSFPSIKLNSRPEKVVLANDIKSISGETAGERAYTILVPAGTYTFKKEDKNYYYYAQEGKNIVKTWTGLRTPRSRERSGGICLVKKNGAWGIFTIGPFDDWRQDGAPEIARLTMSKTEEGYFNWLGFLGRTNESNQMVPVVLNRGLTVMATAESVEGVTFVGSVPIQ